MLRSRQCSLPTTLLLLLRGKFQNLIWRELPLCEGWLRFRSGVSVSRFLYLAENPTGRVGTLGARQSAKFILGC